jgi:hypothetical protein
VSACGTNANIAERALDLIKGDSTAGRNAWHVVLFSNGSAPEKVASKRSKRLAHVVVWGNPPVPLGKHHTAGGIWHAIVINPRPNSTTRELNKRR